MPFQNQPLGTILASILNYDQFCESIGEKPAVDLKKSSYIPCDGRSIVGSQLHKIAGIKVAADKLVDSSRIAIASAPDLRGKFLRGLNVIYSVGQPMPFDPNANGDPDGVNRTVGGYQSDAFKSHDHSGKTGDDSPDHSHGFGGYPYSTNYGSQNQAQNLSEAPNPFYRHTDGANTRHRHSVARDGSAVETRARNIAVYYYLKIN